jgi:hypothetical protein
MTNPSADPDAQLVHTLFGPDAARNRAQVTKEVQAEIDDAAVALLPPGGLVAIGGLRDSESEVFARALAGRIRNILRGRRLHVEAELTASRRARELLVSDIAELNSKMAEVQADLERELRKADGSLIC